MNLFTKYLIASTIIAAIAAYFMTKSDNEPEDDKPYTIIIDIEPLTEQSQTEQSQTEPIKPQTNNIKLKDKEFNDILLTSKKKGLLDETV